MKRNVPGHSHRDEKARASRSEDYEAASHSRAEEEKVRRRREWMLQQKLNEEHERLKKKKILEYEMQRAREKKLRESKGRSSRCSRSSSASKSPPSRHGRTSVSDTPKTLSEKLESSNGTTPIFKGPEGTQISVTELRRIKVDIHRSIPGKSTADDLHREIINPEDVVVKRREGEGSKPIFEREEIKNAVVKTEEVGERRTVKAISSENLESKSKTLKKYTTSPTNVRARSHSLPRTSPHHSRHEDSRHNNREIYRNDREREHNRDKSREYRERHIEQERRRTHPHSIDNDRSRERSRRDHSRSREREERKWDRNSHHRSVRDERSYQEYRGRSRERSRERRDRDRSRELRVPPPHYIEQIPVPIYCGNFPPRPIMVGPLVPIRAQVPYGSVRPPMVGPLRPYPPRFIPPDMYRMRPPPNPNRFIIRC
uniref:female-specific protein transformer-like n=1 Tax=Osmia lignaria TaxID=473952 RepID=UPI001478FBCE|nr:female-specific protein transformer-like [Osmia lignaria]